MAFRIIQYIWDFLNSLKEFLKQSKMRKLQRQRGLILDKIKIVEKKWLKREIDEKTYRELNENYHKRLITVETDIETEKIDTRLKKFDQNEIQKLGEKRRPVLKEALEFKQKIISELERAKKLYMKRKIDEPAFLSISKEKQKLLIETEANINSLYRAEAREIMYMAGQRMAMSEEDKLRIESDEIASNIIEQIPRAEAGGEQGKKEKWRK